MNDTVEKQAEIRNKTIRAALVRQIGRFNFFPRIASEWEIILHMDHMLIWVNTCKWIEDARTLIAVQK